MKKLALATALAIIAIATFIFSPDTKVAAEAPTPQTTDIVPKSVEQPNQLANVSGTIGVEIEGL